MLTQDEYKLYTNQVVNFSQEDWDKLVNIAAARLARFLCLDSLEPETGEALTAEEYDLLGFTAQEYDDKSLTAQEYDTSGKTILMLGGQIHLDDNLAMLLANFLCIMLKKRGDTPDVKSKHIRNYTITYGEAKVAFSQLRRDYGDIIEDYSKCCSGICVERSVRRCCCERF